MQKICLLVLIFLVAVTRRVSVGSMGAFITLPFAITIFSGGIYEDRPLLTLGFALLIGIIVLIKHKDNIKRLIKKEEPRLGLGKKEK